MAAARLSEPAPAGGFGGRVALALLALGVLAPALGDQPPRLDCSSLPDDQRPLCEALAACSEQSSAQARQACFDAAYQRLPADAVDAGPATETSAAVEETVPAPEADADAARTSATTAPSATDQAGEKRRGWFRWLRRKDRAEAPAPPQPSATKPSATKASAIQAERELPDRFEAIAQMVWPHGRDWQMILLDNGLLLEGRGGPRSRVRAGDAVRVRVAKTFGGVIYRLTSPSRRTFEMARLRCARPTGADADKCALARGVRADAGW